MKTDPYSRMSRLGFCAFAALVCAVPTAAQEEPAFGFGPAEPASAAESPADSADSGVLSLSGEASAAFDAYTDDLDSVFAGKVRLDASGSRGEAHIGFAFTASGSASGTASGTASIAVDEGWVRAFFGKADLEAGVRKIVWGKADSEGPLDAINPVDFSDLRVTGQMDRKIARPMLRAGFSAGDFTRLEGVFVPAFVPNRFALSGRWAPAALDESFNTLFAVLHSGGQSAAAQTLSAKIASAFAPETADPKYPQYGLRLTTSFASQDIGIQYLYGNRKTPSVSVDSTKLFVAQPNPLEPENPTLVFNPDALRISCDRFHQAGIDWASVVATLNIRAEAALHLTEDLSGSDGAVSNPDFAWSFGFDRDIAGFTILAQGFGSNVLMHDRIGVSPDDCQGDADATSTRILARISRSFFRGELDFSATVVSGIEDRDWMCLGEISSTRDALSIGCKGGLFGGRIDGDLGQYRGNGWVSAYLTYRF